MMHSKIEAAPSDLGSHPLWRGSFALEEFGGRVTDASSLASLISRADDLDECTANALRALSDSLHTIGKKAIAESERLLAELREERAKACAG